MSKTVKTAQEKRRHKKKYKKYTLRINRDSGIQHILDAYGKFGAYSVNFLVCALVCAHFGANLPHREYTHTQRKLIFGEPASTLLGGKFDYFEAVTRADAFCDAFVGANCNPTHP